jgi:hypothetical protein
LSFLSVTSVHSASSLTPSSRFNGGLAAAQEDVMTTRAPFALVAARSTRSVPSRAGTTSSSSFLTLPPPSGDATWSTCSQPSTAASHPASEVRSAMAKRSRSPGSSAPAVYSLLGDLGPSMRDLPQLSDDELREVLVRLCLRVLKV